MLKDFYNEIIPPWDSRYGKLGHMWKNINEFSKGEGRNSIRYFIPRQLVLYEYNTAKVEITKLPTNWENNNWISSRSTTRLIDESCNLTPQEYYDLTILKINRVIDRPRCAYCHSILPFSYLSNGYAHHSWDSNKKSLCCSLSCSLNYQNSINTGLNSIDSNIRKAYSQFMNKGKLTDECILYLAIIDDGRLKYGITSNIDERIIIEGLNGNEYLTIHKIVSSDRSNIAKLELRIKYEFNGKEYLKFIELNKLIKTIRKILADH